MNKGGGTSWSKNGSGSCLSRFDGNVVTYDAYVIWSTSKKKIISIIVMTLLLSQMMMNMLVYSASPTPIPARMMIPTLINRKR